MSIKQYIEGSNTFYEVYINIRSKRLPSVRVQTRKRRIKTKSKAESTERELIERAYFKIAKSENESKSWGKIISKWYDYKLKDQFEPISSETLSDYNSALQTWTQPFLNKPYNSLNRSEIKNLIQRMDALGKSKSYQSKMKHMINCVFNWAIQEGEIDDLAQSPALGIKINRKSEKPPMILSYQEIIRLLEASRFYNSVWEPIWSVALLTGCRNGELFALTWDDVDFENSFIRITKSFSKRHRAIKSTKGGYWRTVPINEDLRNILLNLKSKSTTKEVLPRPREWCQGNQAKSLRVFCLSIGITPVSFHALRACFATQLLQNSVPAATVMKICGWKDLDVMTRYIRLAGIDESGATDCLKLLTPREAMDKVVDLFKREI
jgi:integrase